MRASKLPIPWESNIPWACRRRNSYCLFQIMVSYSRAAMLVLKKVLVLTGKGSDEHQTRHTICSAKGILVLVFFSACKFAFINSTASAWPSASLACHDMDVRRAHVESQIQRLNHGSRNKWSGSTLNTRWINIDISFPCARNSSAHSCRNCGGACAATCSSLGSRLSGKKTPYKRMQH